MMFPKLESSPMILFLSNGFNAIVTLPSNPNKTSGVEIHVELSAVNTLCIIKTEWKMSEIIDYQAVVQGNKEIIMKIKRQNFIHYLIVEPIYCSLLHSATHYTSNSTINNSFVPAMKLSLKNKALKMYFESTNSSILTITSNIIPFNKLIKNKKKDQLKKYTNIQRYRVDIGATTVDKNNEMYFFIQNIEPSRSSLWLLDFESYDTKEYKFEHTIKIANVTKTLAVDYGQITFCYNDEINNAIECIMFEQKTAEILSEIIIPTNPKVEKMFVYNVDENNSLLIWIEKNLINNSSDVVAQIISRENSPNSITLLNTDNEIGFITYRLDDEVHCLYIGLCSLIDANLMSYCFTLNSDVRFLNSDTETSKQSVRTIKYGR